MVSVVLCNKVMGLVVFAVKVTKKAIFERKVIFSDIIPKLIGYLFFVFLKKIL
jgi:hypothetical protein